MVEAMRAFNSHHHWHKSCTMDVLWGDFLVEDLSLDVLSKYEIKLNAENASATSSMSTTCIRAEKREKKR